MGSLNNVFLCDSNVIKKALARPEISHRPDFFTYSIWAANEQMMGKVSVKIIENSTSHIVVFITLNKLSMVMTVLRS